MKFKYSFKLAIGGILGLLTFVFVTGSALAEGGFNSSITGGRANPPFQSRTWTDKNLDSVNTTITFEGCRDNLSSNDPNDRAIVEVGRSNGIFPGTSMGTLPFDCWNSVTGNWNRLSAADYYFRITSLSYNNATTINVPTVIVRY